MSRLRLIMRPSCTVCFREIKDEGIRLTLEEQVELLKSGEDYYRTCLGCGRKVRGFRGKDYRTRVEERVLEIKEGVAQEEQRLKQAEATKLWSPDTPSLVGVSWLGSCPNCRAPDMYANRDDHFECPECRLQIRALGKVIILPEKGLGLFKFIHRQRVSAVDSMQGSLVIREDYRGGTESDT